MTEKCFSQIPFVDPLKNGEKTWQKIVLVLGKSLFFETSLCCFKFNISAFVAEW